MRKHWTPCWGSRDRHTTEKVREAGYEETTASRALWSHVLPKGTPRTTWRAARGRKLPLLERILHVTLKLLFTSTFTLISWKLKILFESLFDQIQIEARFR